MKTIFRLALIACLVAVVVGKSDVVVAQKKENTKNMPAGLQDAFLAASSQPFSKRGGSYVTEYNGIEYKLNGEGLQLNGGGIQWNISLRGVGRGNRADEVQAPEIVQTEERLEYRRGALTEWYRDTALGLEQGFTLNAPPQGNGKLVLHLDLSSNLKVKLNDDERGIFFAAADGQKLRYGQLKAYDANGVELDARMDYNPAQVIIQVEDNDAAYPITIDPLIYLEQKVIASNGSESDAFGYSVVVSGDTAVVGAPYGDVGVHTNQGMVYVFVRSDGIWEQQQIITALDGAAYDCFGFSVALSGNTALVGAYADDVGTYTNQGSVYVFVRDGSSWSQQAKLTDPFIDNNTNFGSSVALVGDMALVGAPYQDVGWNHLKPDQGAAFVFVRNGVTWNPQAILIVSDGEEYDHFGFSVALSADTALIGAIGYGDYEQGSAYVFVRNGTEWKEQAKLIALDGEAFDSFGTSVALSGDTALVGAPGDTVGTNIFQGSAYIFSREDNSWTQQTKLTDPVFTTSINNYFGNSVALEGDTALIGANGLDFCIYGCIVDAGAAYIFVSSGISWEYQNILFASDIAEGDAFGSSVALSGDTVLVGTELDDVDQNTDQGSAYFYHAYRDDADLVVSTTSNKNTLYPGDAVRLTATIENLGPSEAKNVMVKVNLPAELTYVSHAPGTYTPKTGSWSLGNLPVGQTDYLFIDMTANVVSTPTKTLIFSAQSLARDINDANNMSNLSLTIKKKEHLLNGGFNIFVGTSKIPKNWTAVNFAVIDGKDITAANRKEGVASVKISNTTAKTKTLSQAIPALSGLAGDSFIFSYWVKGTALPVAGLCQAQAIFYNGTTAVGTKTLACGFTRTFAYKQRKISFTAPAAYTKVIIKFTYSKANSTVWFDLVSLLR